MSIKPKVQIRAIEVKPRTFFELDKRRSDPAALFLWKKKPPGRKLRSPQKWPRRDGGRRFFYFDKAGLSGGSVGQLPTGPKLLTEL